MVLLLVAVAGAVIVNQWPGIRRYFKIKQLFTGGGHPENVPAGAERPTAGWRAAVMEAGRC